MMPDVPIGDGTLWAYNSLGGAVLSSTWTLVGTTTSTASATYVYDTSSILAAAELVDAYHQWSTAPAITYTSGDAVEVSHRVTGFGVGGYFRRALRQAVAPLTDEMVEHARQARETREAREAQISAQMSAERERIQQANARARALFLSLLTEAQTLEYHTHQRVTVRGSDGVWYRIECRGDYQGNIVQLDAQLHRVQRYCAHPDMHVRHEGRRMPLPLHDAYITQMLAIQTDAGGFLAVANEYD